MLIARLSSNSSCDLLPRSIGKNELQTASGLDAVAALATSICEGFHTPSLFYVVFSKCQWNHDVRHGITVTAGGSARRSAKTLLRRYEYQVFDSVFAGRKFSRTVVDRGLVVSNGAQEMLSRWPIGQRGKGPAAVLSS